MKILLLVWMGVIGAALGSFACCRAWRLHERTEGRKLGKKSVCMSCRSELAWRDKVPVVSWVMLRGKCRKCGAKIGLAEIVAEVLGAVVGVLMGRRLLADLGIGAETTNGTWQLDWLVVLEYVLLMAIATVFGVLAIYDAKWGELPVSEMMVANLLAVLACLVKIAVAGWKFGPMNVVAAVAILAGVYYLLYFFSREKLVGGGDWILCLAIAIALGDWQLAVLELFISNMLALLVSAPIAAVKKERQVPFGPFLVIGYLVIVTLDITLFQLF